MKTVEITNDRVEESNRMVVSVSVSIVNEVVDLFEVDVDVVVVANIRRFSIEMRHGLVGNCDDNDNDTRCIDRVIEFIVRMRELN